MQRENGEQVMLAGEVDSGLGAALWRTFLKNKRPFSMELRDQAGLLVMTLKRPFYILFLALGSE